MILSKEVWNMTPVPQRVVNCQSLGLSGKCGSKEWDQLTYGEMMAVMGLQAPVYNEAEVESKVEARRQELLASQRSVASDIVSQILAKKSNMEGES